MNPLYLIMILVISLLYVWTIYNIPIVVAGVKNLCSNRLKKKIFSKNKKQLPLVSIIVPVKNEEKVIGRLLTALAGADYPSDKKEIIIVEDGSTDNTAQICKQLCKRAYPNQVKFLGRSVSDGKALQLCKKQSKYVTGEIVGVFDADNIPESDFLLNAVNYFEDSSVAAVQGKLALQLMKMKTFSQSL